MENNLVFKHPLPVHKYKFEDFQKSEMFKEELEEDGFLFTCIATMIGDVIVILKEERIKI